MSTGSGGPFGDNLELVGNRIPRLVWTRSGDESAEMKTSSSLGPDSYLRHLGANPGAVSTSIPAGRVDL